MLNDYKADRLSRLEREIQSLLAPRRQYLSITENRKLYKAMRDVLHLYEDFVLKLDGQHELPEDEHFKTHRVLAEKAMKHLDGQAEPRGISLKEYDHKKYGPFLGVSDEGSAASAIRRAAYSSPKMMVTGSIDPLVAGVSCDAERLAAVGEVAVGPEEYIQIRMECMGRLLTSTNVGTRLNLRYYKKRPVIVILSGSLKTITEDALEQARAAFLPFRHTPDKIPRPVTVFVYFKSRMSFQKRLHALKVINDMIGAQEAHHSEFHKLGLLVHAWRGKKGVQIVKQAIDLAMKAGLDEVAVRGILLKAAEDKISMPGLLNYFSPKHVSELLKYAKVAGVKVSPRNIVDPETVSRNVWRGLCVARSMGLELGKYGLFPLTFEQSNTVMSTIQEWFSSWTAAPVFYVDFPTSDSSNVYTESNIERGLMAWFHIVSNNDIEIVLVDTADKDRGRRLLKNSPSDRVGILSLAQIARINESARNLGIKVLWAGGISVFQAYELGEIGVFGIYVTSAAAVARPVSGRYEMDIMLAAEKEPTFHGVCRVKLLLEAGFLYACLKNYNLKAEADALSKRASAYISALRRQVSEERIIAIQEGLTEEALRAWKTHLLRYQQKA